MSTFNSADMPVLQVQLDVVQQEIIYNAIPKSIPESYWKDELTDFLYPLWDTDKDKLIFFNYYTNGTYFAKRRRYIKNFKTGEYEWKEYEMEQLDSAEAIKLKDKLIEAFYLLDSIAEDDYNQQLIRMYGLQRQVSPLTVRLARNFLLDETDWALASDSPLGVEDREMYTVYRQKLRDITSTGDFTTNVEETKFPISPEFYKKLFSVENSGLGYLATPEQFIPMGRHYLKQFRDRIAQYLVLKSLTEKNYFDTLLNEYQSVQHAAAYTPESSELSAEDIEARKEWLEDLLRFVDEKQNEDGGAA
jgi:hypothetical protein